MRDYGTGEWEGGDPDCHHLRDPEGGNRHGSYAAAYIRPETGKPTGGSKKQRDEPGSVFHDVCGRCGARRVDQQLGLEPTPDQYVQRIVHVFREVRRVLAGHGTCWVNLGDSYASAWSMPGGRRNVVGQPGLESGKRDDRPDRLVGGLKEKDLVGIPWRVAFALQADGWWLRSDIIWAKPNPMPESVTDRPTKAHEYVFLLTKQPRYWFDQEAVREPHNPDGRKVTAHPGPGDYSIQERSNGDRWPNAGRNVRSVWTVATQPYPEAHFATYPEELVRRCVLAGCPGRVCVTCGKPSERIVERQNESTYARIQREHGITYKDMKAEAEANGITPGNVGGTHAPGRRGAFYESPDNQTLGWSDCGHNTWRPGLVLDPFAGSGTTCKVARDHGRHSIGIDLSADYLELAARRLQQQSLFSEVT